MLVNLIEIKTTEKEALKKILSKIPLLSKVTQFNKGINDIDLKYIEYKILKYKIGNYENLRAGKIPNCSKNTDAPDMTIAQKETNNIWYIMAIISLVEIVAGFIPWVSIYYGDVIEGMSVSCGSIFELIQKVSNYSQWAEDLSGILNLLILIAVLNICVIGSNIYFLISVIQKKYDGLPHILGLRHDLYQIPVIFLCKLNGSCNHFFRITVNQGIMLPPPDWCNIHIISFQNRLNPLKTVHYLSLQSSHPSSVPIGQDTMHFPQASFLPSFVALARFLPSLHSW